MCYSSIITAMEAYLGDILQREIFTRPAVKKRFVASYAPFKNEKLKLSELYTKLAGIARHLLLRMWRSASLDNIIPWRS